MRNDPFKMLIDRPRRRVVPLLLVVALTLGLLSASTLVIPSQAEPLTGSVWLDPPSQQVSEGSIGSVAVRSDGLTDICSAMFTISFDPVYLEVVDADGNPGNGVQITPGTCPSPDFVAVNAADNSAGTIVYQIAQLAPAAPCDGGVIASMEFLCRDMDGLEPVAVPITITEIMISECNGAPLDFMVQHGEIICVPGCTIKGTALPQAHQTDATGVSVCMEENGCITTGADGVFQLAVSEDVPHTVVADCIHHLATRITDITCGSGETIDVGTMVLRAGDLNDDGAINILDVVLLGGNFGGTEPTGW